MAKRRGKSVSFDAMVKFFMQSYNIPTRKDVEKLLVRLDRLEDLIKSRAGSGTRGRIARKVVVGERRGPGGKTASDTVLDIVKRSRSGVGFSDIQAKAGYDEKKLRNIIFRLNKLGRIKRKSRGLYMTD
ncbi:MAG TPA: hypothetical protein HPQ03_15350 [Deltaproteobacteria bacterium]|nr:hypothetical protein [Deltaproteobacteria bacterium]